jgi:predicted nucleic acid-binding protein
VIVLLDAGPLGRATNPKPSKETQKCSEWITSLLQAGVCIAVPEITDYEVRRELIRANKINGLRRLDAFKNAVTYLPLTTEVMLKAAELWASARKQGRPSSSPEALDADMILVAQALILIEQGNDAIIATTNVKHLSPFTQVRHWHDDDWTDII